VDFSSPVEVESFRNALRAWLAANLTDDVVAAGRSRGRRDAAFETLRAWDAKTADAGWAAVSWPEEFGGRGATVLEQLAYAEETTRARAPLPLNVIGLNNIAPAIMQYGSEAQNRTLLPRMMRADDIWCQGMSEPEAGSDLASLRTRAVRDGDDFVVNGQKIWTSLGQRADWCQLYVRTDPDAPKHKGISYILVDMHSPGITVRPLTQITGERGFNEVFFEDVRVPKKNIVGEKNHGWQVAITTLMFERTGVGDPNMNTNQVLELARLAKLIRRNGTSAWDDTSVRQRIAQFAAEAAALKYTGYRQITRRLKGRPPGPEGSVMKLGSSELHLRIAKFAMELLGPYSQFEHNAPFALGRGVWSYRMLGARAYTIAGGTSEIQHNIIGERVLGLPKG
jgi:alkylation response protein AidB-like acyl-CoA dehydrogenase